MYSVKDWIKLVLLVVFYISLGVFNIYNNTLIFLFPIIAIPLTIFLMGNKKNVIKENIIHIAILVGIFLLSGDYKQSLLYILGIVVPAYLVISLYRKKFSIPKIIMVVGVVMGAILVGYTVFAKYMGIDYIQIYLNAIDQYQDIQMKLFNELLAQSSVSGLTEVDFNLLKDIIQTQVLVFKMVYPALFMLLCLFLSLLYIALITFIGNLKGWRLPTLKQLMYFRFSKVAALLIVVGVLAMQLDTTTKGIWSMTGINLYFLFSSLFQLVGIVAVVMLIRKSKLSGSVKVLGIIASIMIFYSMPLAMTVVGLGDSLFNFRKVENIV